MAKRKAAKKTMRARRLKVGRRVAPGDLGSSPNAPSFDLSLLAPFKDGGARPAEPSFDHIDAVRNSFLQARMVDLQKQPAYLVRLRGGPHDGMVLGVKILQLPDGQKIMQIEVLNPPDDMLGEAAIAEQRKP